MNNGAAGDALMQQNQQQGMMTMGEAASSTKPRLPGLPPTPPQPTTFQSMDVDMGLPPRNSSNNGNKAAAHRRSRSDVPFGQFQLPPPKVEAGWGGPGDADDLFNAYLNLEGLDGLNHSDGDSSVKTDGSENESEEGAADGRGVRLWPADGAGAKRAHARSLSMDSLIGSFNFAAAGTSSAANGVMPPGPNRFRLDFGSGEFTPAEMKKIMADDKLAEMALADPKRVKRYPCIISSENTNAHCSFHDPTRNVV